MPDASPCPAAPVLSLEDAAELRASWRTDGACVVLTNGCFDLLHVGHTRYLASARALGDRLIVAVNDDASTARLKGPRRPLQPLSDRAELLAALRHVDAVVPFGGQTAVDVVRALQPDVYVKGGDYDAGPRRPPEAGVAESLGARVVFVDLVAGRSTSALVARLLAGDS